MKIIPNIPGFAKLIYCLKYFNAYKKKIASAKAAENYAEERGYILEATSTWGPMIMDMFGSTVEVEGLDNLPEEGPVVIVGNHQGYADIAAYFAAFRKFQFAFVAKKELSKIPLYGVWMGRIRSVFIERNDPRASLEAIKAGADLVGNQPAQFRVAKAQPPPLGDAVGLVLEPLGPEGVPGGEQIPLQDLAVDFGHAVGGVGGNASR